MKNINVFAVFQDRNFNATLANNFIKFWTTGPSIQSSVCSMGDVQCLPISVSICSKFSATDEDKFRNLHIWQSEFGMLMFILHDLGQ